MIKNMCVFTHSNPLITIEDNFDKLLIPKNHPSRSVKDSYYIDESHLFRTHMTGNEQELLRRGITSFLVSGPVFRRDEIDCTHYPIFHQLEGVHRVNDYKTFCIDKFRLNIVESAEYQHIHSTDQAMACTNHLMDTLECALRSVLGDSVAFRWVPSNFPFTFPSFELEVEYNGKWVEVLGCGLLMNGIVDSVLPIKKDIFWAFGLGLERLAMIMFDIPDIRLFWADDPRFLDQFKEHSHTNKVKYKPLSRQPAAYRDISFWIMPDFSEGDFFETVRDLDCGMVESVKEIDSYIDNVSKRRSKTYRLEFRIHSRPLTKREIDAIFEKIRLRCGQSFAATLR